MSVAWYWPGWGCSDPPEESCSDAACPVHGDLPEYDPAGEAERVAEVFDQAATDYAAIEWEG